MILLLIKKIKKLEKEIIKYKNLLKNEYNRGYEDALEAELNETLKINDSLNNQPFTKLAYAYYEGYKKGQENIYKDFNDGYQKAIEDIINQLKEKI